MASKSPIVITPRCYHLGIPDNDWGWSRMEDVLMAAKNRAARKNLEFKVENALDFLIRFSRVADLRPVSVGKFHFSRAGHPTLETMSHTELEGTKDFLTQGLFVSEGWMRDALRVVENGGVRVRKAVSGDPEFAKTPKTLLGVREDGTSFKIKL